MRPVEQTSGPQRKRATSAVHVACLASIALCVLGAYGPSLTHDFVWDDQILIVDNRFIKDASRWPQMFYRDFWELSEFSDPGRHFYRPLVSLSYMIDYAVWGLDAWGFHLTNILMHLACACLVYFIVFHWLGSPLQATAAAALFALHPTRVENVVWIAGRTDLACGIFFFAAVLSFIRAVGRLPVRPGLSFEAGDEASESAATQGPASMTRAASHLRWLPAVLVFYALALLAKEMAIILPLLLLAYYAMLDRRRYPWRAFVWPLTALSTITVAYLVIRHWVLGAAVATMASGGFWQLARAIPFVFTKYLELLLFLPIDPHHADEPARRIFQISALPSLLVPIGYLALIAHWRRRKDLLAFALLWVPLSLLPVLRLGFADVLYADRFLYLPSFGFALLLVLLGHQAAARARAGLAVRSALALAGAACLALYFLVLRQHMAYWRNDVVLFSHAARTSPNSAYVHQNLGRALTKMGEYDRALEAYSRAKALQSLDGALSVNQAAVYEKLGDDEKALALYREALALGLQDHVLHFNLANTLHRVGQIGLAIQHYERSLEIRQTPRAHANLGNLYFARGDLERAWRHYEAAVELEPSRVGYNNLGAVLLQQKKYAEAIFYFERAIELEPGAASPHLNLAEALYHQRDLTRAADHARRALEILQREGHSSGKIEHARRLLAASLARTGRASPRK